ncbi:MAG: MarR family winged helix-turn-helix transcriptional regulator [Oscillospiraceae bacterium]|jgi:DNA-binding MarR family transcriptional regulator
MRKGIGYFIKSINDKLEVNGNADMAKFGITFPQSRVLAVMYQKGGEMTQKELEKELQVSHPTVVGLVSRMQRQGFLETGVDPKDRRNKIVKLTGKAESVGEEMDRTISMRDREMLSGLTDAQIDELFWMLEVIDSNIPR